MTENRSFGRMSMEPKPIIYDQNSRPVSNADLNSLNTPVELHGLYCKKFRLIEKLENLRKGYILPKGVPVVNVHKVRMERKFTPWDYVLEEVKWTAIDMIEERKAKLTVCSFLSKKMKKDVKQRQTHQQEKTIYHRLVSSEMASMVSTVFGHFRSKRESTDVKKEDIAEIIKEEEERNGETFFGEMKDGDILDYDEMKMKIEEPSMKNGEGARDKGDLPVDALISDAFKPKKLKDSGALLRKYIDSFIAYEERSKARELVIEEDDNFPTPGAFFAKKIDKVHFYKELQRCMNKWNKNKSSMELNDVFSKLIKDASESESMMKLQKDNLSTYSAPSIKETDTKKRKKGNQHLTASNANLKDIKDPPALRKMTDSNIEQAGQPSNKELKKMKEKEKENMDEMLIMYYEQPLKDTEYELMFKNSIANNKSFPRRVDELQTVGFVKSIEKDRIYREFTFDPDYDDFVSDNCLELEAYVSQIDRKYSSDPKRMGDEATKQKVRSLPIECSVNIPDVFNFLPHIEEKPFFIYMDKVIKFIRASEDSPDFKKQLDNITWPLHADYFYERLHETHGNRYAIITDALNSNILTKGNHKYQEKISEFKWLFMHSNKNRKFFNCAKKRLPSYSTVTKETAYSDAQEEKKQSLPQGSSHQRFNLRFHVDKYQDYYKEKEDKRSKESYESSFLLFQNIKNHLRQDTSRGLYGGEGPQPTRMPEAIEHVALTRMIWPEAMNQNLISKIQSGQPLSGRPIDKEKTPHPQLDKIIDEIISATYQNPKPAPVPIPMPNPTPNPSMGMPISQPHPISAQTHSQVPPQPMHNQPQPMSHTGQPQPAGQPASQPMPLQTVNSPHLNPGPMTPGGTYPMKYPSNMPMQNPQMAYPGHMRGPMPDPMRPQPGMIPNQPTPEMYDQNNQPMPRQQGGNVPRGMQQNIPSNMQPSMAQSMPPTMQSNMQPSMQPGMAQNMPPTMQSNMQPSMGPNMHPQGYNNQMQPNNPKMMMGGPSGGPPPDGRNYPHNQQYYNNMPNNMQMQQMMQNKQPQQYQMRGINNMKNIGPNPGNPMMSGDNRNVGNMQSGPNMMNMSSMPNMPNGAPNMGHGNMPMNPAMGSSPMGNPQMGGPSMGNPHMGNPGMGNPGMGNPGMGNPGMGNPGMGNPGMGNPGMGNPGMGNPSMGNPSMGNPNMPMGGMPMGNQPSMGGAMPPMNAAPDTKKTKNTKNR